MYLIWTLIFFFFFLVLWQLNRYERVIQLNEERKRPRREEREFGVRKLKL